MTHNIDYNNAQEITFNDRLLLLNRIHKLPPAPQNELLISLIPDDVREFVELESQVYEREYLTRALSRMAEGKLKSSMEAAS